MLSLYAQSRQPNESSTQHVAFMRLRTSTSSAKRSRPRRRPATGSGSPAANKCYQHGIDGAYPKRWTVRVRLLLQPFRCSQAHSQPSLSQKAQSPWCAALPGKTARTDSSSACSCVRRRRRINLSMAPVVRRGKRPITATTPTTVLQNGSGRRKKANRRTSDTLF